MRLNTVNPYQKTMTASKDDQSVPESVDGRSQHESRVKYTITTDDQYLPYPKDDCGPYDDKEAVLGGRKENENLYDSPAKDWEYDIQGPQGQNFQEHKFFDRMICSGCSWLCWDLENLEIIL